MWEVRVEEYSRFTHKTLTTKYQFDGESDAIDFINNLKKENSKCGIWLYNLYEDALCSDNIDAPDEYDSVCFQMTVFD